MRTFTLKGLFVTAVSLSNQNANHTLFRRKQCAKISLLWLQDFCI